MPPPRPEKDEELTAIRQELRLERLERMIREQEVSRLLNEILSHLNANQLNRTSTTLVHSPIPTNRVTEPPTDTAIQRRANTVTHLASNESITIIQSPVTQRETDDGPEPMPGEEIRTSWLTPNHRDNYVPDEFVCRWTPCDVVFDSYGDLTRHIRTHQLAVRCKWSGCNDIVPVTEALRHLTCDKHNAYQDGVCRWNNCSQEIADKRKLVSHLTKCMNLHFSVFKCPWRGCHKYIKRDANMKRHLLQYHWKLRKWRHDARSRSE
jgi:uncharacterized Zn-finger protein